ncbi:type II secretion system protein GspG [Photobacterium satsumensis]|uniref:type II secretion system protein GspG n=1 Tax=Photobacterium satsumensis TaxID=2910239 RepID=UPI003D1285EA
MKLSIYIVIVAFFFISISSNASESVSGNISKSRELEQICLSLMMFKLDRGRWPTEEEGLYVLSFAREGEEGYTDGHAYLDVIEQDPWGNDYIYKAEESRFELWSVGADSTLGTQDDIGPDICKYVGFE